MNKKGQIIFKLLRRKSTYPNQLTQIFPCFLLGGFLYCSMLGILYQQRFLVFISILDVCCSSHGKGLLINAPILPFSLAWVRGILHLQRTQHPSQHPQEVAHRYLKFHLQGNQHPLLSSLGTVLSFLLMNWVFFLDSSITLTFPQDQFSLPCTLINNLLNHIHCVHYGCCHVLVAEMSNCNKDGKAQETTIFPNEFANRVWECLHYGRMLQI